MGAELALPDLEVERVIMEPIPVLLHIYDLGIGGGGACLNRFLRPLGTGAFHCGVEVYGSEWAFSDTVTRLESTGVFCCPPKDCEGHTFSDSLNMGNTLCSEPEVLK